MQFYLLLEFCSVQKQILRKRRRKNIFNSRFTAKTRCTKTNTYPCAGHDGLLELWETICQAQYRPSLSSSNPCKLGVHSRCRHPSQGVRSAMQVYLHIAITFLSPPVSILFPLFFPLRPNFRPFREQPILLIDSTIRPGMRSDITIANPTAIIEIVKKYREYFEDNTILFNDNSCILAFYVPCIYFP